MKLKDVQNVSLTVSSLPENAKWFENKCIDSLYKEKGQRAGEDWLDVLQKSAFHLSFLKPILLT